MAQPDPNAIVPLRAYLDSIQSAAYAEYAAKARAKVVNEHAFAEMKAHILQLYQGVEAVNSFSDEGGGVFDCIPVEQQPALRGSTGRPLTPPTLPAGFGDEPDDAASTSLIESPLRPDRKDQHGNLMYCPDGTIPMRRVTLDDLTRFETLHDFFSKGARAEPPSAARSAGRFRPARPCHRLPVCGYYRWL